jgi:surface protein
MFYTCKELTQLDLSNWVTSSVTGMVNMFAYCFKLTQLDVSNWDVSSVTNMSFMFSDCTQLTTIGGVSNWDTKNVTNMNNMFTNCKSLTKLDLSNWTFKQATDISDMFKDCTALKKVKVKKIDNDKFFDNNFPTMTEENKGYLFIEEEYPNDRYWECLLMKERKIDLILPQPLRSVGDIADRLYWDNNKKHYCIEKNIGNDLSILDTPEIINLIEYNEPIMLYQQEGTTIKTSSASPIKPKKISISYKDIKDI